MNHRLKIILDINSSIPYFREGHVTGVGRSTLELIEAMKSFIPQEFEVVLFSQNTRGSKYPNPEKLRYCHFYLPNRRRIKMISNKLKLKKLLIGYDLIHIPHNTDVTEDLKNTIYTIHDLIVYRYPEMWGLTDEERLEHKRIAKGCRHIITCSEASKNDIIHFWGVPANKVSVIPWGINRIRFYPNSDQLVLKKYGITKRYYFCCSCNHPRKNLSLLLLAFEKYLKAGGDMQLVLLSPGEKELEPYDSLIDCGNIIVVRDISDTDLTALYTHAHASIMVSLYEGFGLPILESLACRTQVLCANNSCFPEVGGDIIKYFDELTDSCVAKTMLEFASIPKEQMLDIDLLEKHLAKFTWDNCARQYFKIYERLLKK